MNDKLILYPSNWLYNAGVVGLMSLIEKTVQNIQNYFIDGNINGDELLDSLKEITKNKKCIHLNEPFNTLPLWYLYYIEDGFNWNYSNLRSFISQNLVKASSSGNKSNLKKQLKIKKNIKYYNYEFYETNINQVIDDVYSSLSNKNEKISLTDAIDRIFNSITNDEKNKILYIYRKFVGALFSKTKSGVYQNFFHKSKYDNFENFLEFFDISHFLIEKNDSDVCSFCNNNLFKLIPIKTEYMSLIFPNYNEFPNSFWNNDQEKVTRICGLCNFILLHHHLALTKMPDSQIFINAPSFKVMYELNKLVREVYGTDNYEESKSKREILAMSIIEYSRKIATTLGLWTGMNIEIVTRSSKGIDFFSLPYDVVKIISDREVASLLSELGEFKILNNVLDKKYAYLTEIAYLLLRESTKDYNERNNDLIKSILYRWDNQRNLVETANKILKLYSLIEEKIKRS